MVLYRSPEVQFGIRNQSWPLYKTVKCQLRVIIWTNLVVLKRPVLYNKFEWYQPFRSEEDF